MQHADLTMLVQRDDETGWYSGQLEEFPAAISQGKTMEELEQNLIDALRLLLEVQKDSLKESYAEIDVKRRNIQFAA